jgi:hypothetical protein
MLFVSRRLRICAPEEERSGCSRYSGAKPGLTFLYIKEAITLEEALKLFNHRDLEVP